MKQIKRKVVGATVAIGLTAWLAWAVVIAVTASLAWAAPTCAAYQPFPQSSLLTPEKVKLALSLRDYGMWREEHDRNTFPTDMPKPGEPYDPVTGNAIRGSK